MRRREDFTLLIPGLLLVLTTLLLVTLEPRVSSLFQGQEPVVMKTGLLSDPFLQYPTSTSTRVVWFTEFEGQDHEVIYGQPGQSTQVLEAGNEGERRAIATTTQLSRTREDADSKVTQPEFQDLKQAVRRAIWRHEAVVTGLSPGVRVPYHVISQRDDGSVVKSRVFTLAAAPSPGQPLKILLTSDHQLMPMTPANLQKVQETVGQVDAVFLAGDLVNIPDRASEWFDHALGNAFFPSLQGRADYSLERNGTTTRYRGGELIQHAPLFPALGNHEVMGRYSSSASLNAQFGNPLPRSAALQTYEANVDLFNPSNDPGLRRQWIVNNSFNSDTYEEIFSLPVTSVLNPERPEETSRYYAVTFGDVRLVSLYVAQIWRTPDLSPTARGRYQEREQDLGTPQNWGYGHHIFESIAQGSLQYQWLQQELASEAFRRARYKVVMFHHPPHTLGDNIVPPFADPVPVYDRWPDGSLKAVRYEYPKPDDQIMRDLVPLLENAGVDLVFYGHSHLWNRFISPSGTHYLEASNVGNTYGAYWQDKARPVPSGDAGFTASYYTATGDPNGLEPVMPTLVSPPNDTETPQPFLASNEVTVFSIFDTGTGLISSYYFDTRQPSSAAVKFDEFPIGQP
ncbi:metallophosphoesterase [Pseudanabaena sp. FACHB-2040]|uniref:metallophosphoesterase family protein n=1 Tax=Pseudanabaena sp. FACHB-2040 TaxID=2692859 RepID=UPI0016855BD9|nr:metallophosphoesterase [Pseudanabaena sp. FACHB-2040]MBD2257747.1 metallophosphoesterase [Pseudanabaena sp. FACHB-2040]